MENMNHSTELHGFVYISTGLLIVNETKRIYISANNMTARPFKSVTFYCVIHCTW